MKTCPDCKTKTEKPLCPGCGHIFTTAQPEEVSVDEASLDLMVQAASVPDLGVMYARAQAAGYIQPAFEYATPA